MTHPELLKRITVRPDIFDGKPIIRDMRISVELILSLLAQGVKPEAILADYPELEEADLQACVAYAHAVISHEYASRDPSTIDTAATLAPPSGTPACPS
ncbi:MAG: DUF433 domain-containing protein, partial [Candidatus Latescibacteria bacterium]|nr:DUF433 domain-containing protein [Candidatus Latescibacterota bacterium]